MQTKWSRFLQHVIILCSLLIMSGVATADPLDTWQWRNPLPQGNSLSGVTNGNGTFVAVGELGTILTSTDSTNWANQSSGVTTNLNKITYGNGTFVAVGDSGTILTSPDGITWTSRFSGSTNYLTSVAYGNGTFVVSGGGGTILSSSDATNWTSRSSGTTQDLLRVVYGNNMFVVVGNGSTILTSTDLNTWTSRYNGIAGTYYIVGLNMAFFANNIFVVMGNDGVTFTSSDGINWAINMSGASQPIFGATYGNNIFVAVGYRNSITSTDGLNWTNLPFGTTEFLDDVVFGNGTFVAVGFGGTILNSTDAINWTSVRSGPNDFLNCITYGNSTFVAVGNYGTILTSPNATNWVSNSSGTTERLASVTHSNGTFVIVGNNGTILNSIDGYSWTNRSSISTENLYLSGVTYGNEIFVAVGQDSMGAAGIILTSDDSVNWAPRSSTSTPLLSKVAFGNGLFVAVGNGTILTSSDGINWTSQSPGILQPLTDVAYGNGTFVAVGFDGFIITSADGTTWTNQSSGAIQPLTAVAYGNDMFSAVGFDNHIISSSDGLIWTTHSLPSGFFNSLTYGNGTFILAGPGGRILQSAPLTSFTVTLNAGPNGIITGPNSVSYGDNATYTISPNAGYHVAEVQVDGVSVGAVTTYTFKNVTIMHTISSIFAANPTYSVTYNNNGSSSGSVPTDADSYLAGATVTVQGNTENLSKIGYTFVGWSTYADGSGTNFTPAETFTIGASNVTLYATWTINFYTVSFNSNGGSAVLSQSVPYNTPGAAPTITTQAGYTFTAWYSDAELIRPFNFSTAITGNTTLYAKWIINYTVSYNSNGGSSVNSQSVVSGSATTTPASPTKTGYTFAGWYSDSGLTTVFNFSTAIAENITLYAKWTINYYSVTFNSNGGSAVSSQSVAYNSTATAPVAPTQAGYTFAGWYSDAALTSAYSFTTTVTGNIPLYAKWAINYYTVTFNSNGGNAVSSQSVAYNSTATAPTVPTKTGYTFTGWYTDSGLISKFSFTTAITSNTTLYAKWTINYKVTFNSNGGSTVSSLSVASNSTAIAPSAPTKTGYTFAGWYTDNALTKPFAFTTSITRDITLYAKWTINYYSVTFNSNGGSAVSSQSVAYNSTATAPVAPTQAGYTFAGWYSDAALTTAYSFTRTVTGNIPLYAKWAINYYTVTFNSNGGSPVNSQSVAYNSTATIPTSPKKHGYIFAGWYSDSALSKSFSFTMTITGKITLYAKWTK